MTHLESALEHNDGCKMHALLAHYSPASVLNEIAIHLEYYASNIASEAERATARRLVSRLRNLPLPIIADVPCSEWS